MSATSSPPLLARTYRRLRRAGERESFLRHCVSVYQPETCGQAAAAMLRRHRRLAELAQMRAAAPFYRLDVRVTVALKARYERAMLYRQRAVLQTGALLSDAFVLFTMVACAVVVAQSFSLLRIALRRLELLDAMSQSIFETAELLENAAGQDAARRAATPSGTQGRVTP
jgi:hypothetical protein